VTGAIEKLAASGQLEALEIDGVQLHGKRGEKEYVGRWRFLAGSEELILKTEMAEGESAAVMGSTGLPASRVASPY
jgi:hypothetical protein